MAASIGERLRELRKARGWSQQFLADSAGLTNSAISQIEKGYYLPKMDTLETLVRALGADLVVEINAGPAPPVVEAARRLTQEQDQSLAAALLDLLPRLDARDRRTLQLLVESWTVEQAAGPTANGPQSSHGA